MAKTIVLVAHREILTIYGVKATMNNAVQQNLHVSLLQMLVHSSTIVSLEIFDTLKWQETKQQG